MKNARRNLLKLSLATLLPSYGCKSAAMQPAQEHHFVLIGDSWVGNPSIMAPPLLSAWGGTATSYGYPGLSAPLINTQTWPTLIAAVNPDAVVWTYGVNDYYMNADPNAETGIGQSIKDTAALIQAVLPGIKMLYLLPAQTEGNGDPLYSWQSYQHAAAASASEVSGLNYFDMGEVIDPYTAGNTDWRNGSHISVTGYQKLFAHISIETEAFNTPVNVSGMPDQPIGLQGVVYSDSAVEIFWDRIDDNTVVGYEVRRDGTVMTTRIASSFFDDSLSGDNSYLYTVSAIDIHGNRSALSKITTRTASKTRAKYRLDPIN